MTTTFNINLSAEAPVFNVTLGDNVNFSVSTTLQTLIPHKGSHSFGGEDELLPSDIRSTLGNDTLTEDLFEIQLQINDLFALKANLQHTHTANQITDFESAVTAIINAIRPL
jgi:hypothetical protein